MIIRISKLLVFLLFNLNQHTASANDFDIFLLENAQPAHLYVLNKFDSYDYVFLGEHHRLKYDLKLVKQLIPLMQSKGILNLAIEFGNAVDQRQLDVLLTAKEFDRDAVKKILWDYVPLWGYAEYIDLFMEAWKVNQNRNGPMFRIILLHPKYQPCKQGGPWSEINPDHFMAEILNKQVVSKNQKALIYAGAHHSFTKYHQPFYDFKKKKLKGFTSTRMGNIIYAQNKSKTFNIFLHSPWGSKKFRSKKVLPMDGEIDHLMERLNLKNVGFDVVGGPLESLRSNSSYYSLGHPEFTLGDFADGYIYFDDFKEYEFVMLEKNFLNPKNFVEFVSFARCTKLIDFDSPAPTFEQAYDLWQQHSLFKHKLIWREQVDSLSKN